MTKKQIPHRKLVKAGLPRKGGVHPPADQMTQDLEKAKAATGKFVDRLKGKVKPVIAERAPFLKEVAEPARSLFSGDLVKKLVRTAIVALLLILLLYIASLFVKKPNDVGIITKDGLPTPTVVPYLPYNPSVYAEDELVLRLEEEIKVLDREISTARLKETILTPPSLDFDIDFED